MSHYAPYDPNATAAGTRYGAANIRIARREDSEAITRMSAERGGLEPDAIRERVARELAGPAGENPWCVFAAEVQGAVVGYGRARDLTRADGGLPDELPEGWYLTGVVVAPTFRRRGLGAALVKARLDWLAGRTDTVHYVSNRANRASIDLHARFGFEALACEFAYPRAGLAVGEGLAFHLRLPAPTNRRIRI